MDYKIIVDSCCDLTPEYRERMQVTTVPLTLTLGEESYVDDEKLNLIDFMQRMKNCTGRVGSAAPSPVLYQEAFRGARTSFAITLSSNLSSSYTSAMLGKRMAEDEDPNADVHVFDSKSASAGQVLLAVKLRRMLDEKLHKSEIVTKLESFIKDMKTYFVLDNIDNLVKNGRLNKIAGKIISILHIRPIMGSDGDGNIVMYGQARGEKQIISKLIDLVANSGRQLEGESMVITHCNNPSLAEKLQDAIMSRFPFKEIIVMPTNGVSSLYANERGIVMAF
ncbi:DegV domain-containing protein [Insulibacter thermoxylanivorax]|uniref:DegV domain-containing protein n=1 Tax=Insulibacter thermoxylanivorax TaxID=2749268 RepID=A0A916VF30_9BACL|nr:DegV family protein [Insulibacter thermoxylanivorax]GFR37867.1 DegV domain-containing protein [Insulibacter thermoxylanivorax]